MILVDTSVWIDYLIGRNTPFRHEFHRLIENSAEIAMVGTVFQEILQGIRSDFEFRRIEKYLSEFTYLPLDEPKTFRQAANLYRECRKRGKSVRKPVDCLIAAQAMAANAELFHNDRDFTYISQVVPLKIYQIPT